MINKQLNTFFGEWKQVMEYRGDYSFCYDDLVYRLSASLYGLTRVNASGYFSLREAFDYDTQMKFLRKFPYSYVNEKKKIGGVWLTMGWSMTALCVLPLFFAGS